MQNKNQNNLKANYTKDPKQKNNHLVRKMMRAGLAKNLNQKKSILFSPKMKNFSNLLPRNQTKSMNKNLKILKVKSQYVKMIW